MRVLFLTHRLPFAPNRGDRIRAFNLLKALHGCASVNLVSLVHDREEEAEGGRIRHLVDTLDMCRVPRTRNRVKGALLLGSQRTLTHILLDSPDVVPALARVTRDSKPDVVLAYCSSMARYALAPPLAGLPLVVDMVDVDSAKWSDLASHHRWPLRWIYARESRLLSQFEARLSNVASATTVVTNREAVTLLRLAPSARILVSSIGIDATRLIPNNEPTDGEDVIFCGVMNYAPNVDAAIWLCRRVWPAVRARRPRSRLWLVGASPPSQVRALADDEAGIEVTGTVDDVRPYLWRSAVSVAPLLTARGTQTKVLEAVASGLPAVVTDAVAGGLPDALMPACVVANSPEQFANAIVALLERSGCDRRAIAGRANLSSLSWDAALAPLVSELTRAAASTMAGMSGSTRLS
jgi:sugar transferase (PEP-CTERM/EpsH1 system associated)